MEDYDNENGLDPELNALSEAVIGAAIEVNRVLGPEFDEVVYERSLALEMDARGITYSRQHSFAVTYRGEVVGQGRLDFLVGGRLVVELKSVEQLTYTPHRWWPTCARRNCGWES